MRDFTDTYPMLPHRLDAETIGRLRACSSDACRQGHKTCPTPSACELPEQQASFVGGRALLLYLLTALLAMAGAVIHFWPQIVAFVSAP